ncbi:excalibur calcium-binding domain-containing protein [Neobacillus drentensis]|uniref:excalibur calcium-binding domain-containing protein n=1 Tax=Neobacillus drentensis TaxID=220684 RepID=UPI002FFE3856
MERKNILVSTIMTVFSIFLLSGCGNEATANSVVEALENEDYDEATQIFDDAVYESDDPYEIHEATSKAIREYLDDIYGDYYDTSNEESFYTLLDNIESIGIDDDELYDALTEFRSFQDVSYSEEDNYSDDESYSNEDVSYDEEDTSSDTDTYIDMNCTDFSTQEEAQQYFEDNGGTESDPDDLDRDGDGIACEWNNDDSSEEVEYQEEEAATSDNPYTATDIDHDCPDFETQEDAQLFFEANGGPEEDPHDLDRDNDGMACDWN